MAYLSAALVVGVQCLGTFCHGPQSRRLVFRAKEAETKFEAALQLSLLARIYLSSGAGTSASLLAALSSILVISKNGVENFLQRHERKLSEASTLGKISVAASVLPAFLLTTVFKLGACVPKDVCLTHLFLVLIGWQNVAQKSSAGCKIPPTMLYCIWTGLMYTLYSTVYRKQGDKSYI